MLLVVDGGLLGIKLLSVTGAAVDGTAAVLPTMYAVVVAGEGTELFAQTASTLLSDNWGVVLLLRGCSDKCMFTVAFETVYKK